MRFSIRIRRPEFRSARTWRRGFTAFQEEDAAVYFGRDDDIGCLIERLEARCAQGGAKLITLLAHRVRASLRCCGTACSAAQTRRPQLDRRPAESGRRAPARRARGRVGCGASEAQILIPIDRTEELGCGRELQARQ
jgi:hypothetical protein